MLYRAVFFGPVGGRRETEAGIFSPHRSAWRKASHYLNNLPIPLAGGTRGRPDCPSEGLAHQNSKDYCLHQLCIFYASAEPIFEGLMPLETKDNSQRCVWATFEAGLQHRRRFGSQQNAPGVLVEGAAPLARNDQLPYEARAIPDVVVLVVFSQVEDVLGQQLGLEEEVRQKWELGAQLCWCVGCLWKQE